MSTTFAMFAALLTVVPGSQEPNPGLAGTWEGIMSEEGDTVHVRLVLKEDEERISGTYTLSGDEDGAGTVTGTYRHPDVTVSLVIVDEDAEEDSVRYQATRIGDDRIEGFIIDSDFDDRFGLVLTRTGESVSFQDRTASSARPPTTPAQTGPVEEATAFLDAMAACVSEHSEAIAESLPRLDWEELWAGCGLDPSLGSLSELARVLVQDALESSMWAMLEVMDDDTIPSEDVVASFLEALSRAADDVRSMQAGDSLDQAAEREVLEAFYHAMGGPDSPQNSAWSAWLSDLPLDRWSGVSTNADGWVVGLSVGGTGVRGPMPPTLGRLLGQLTSLRSLMLSFNDFSGPIPPDLGELTSLVRLDLSNNDLSGQVPPELGNLTALTELSIDDGLCLPAEIQATVFGRLAAESGVSPCGEREVLEAFYHATGGPDWWGSWAGWLSDLPLGRWRGVSTKEGRVETLDLSAALASGPIPPALADLTSLRFLWLGSNRFNGPIPAELGQLTNLETLDLNGSNLSGSIPPELGQLTNLETLYLGGNELSGPIPVELGNLAALASLGIDEDTGLCLPAEMQGTAFGRLAADESVRSCGASSISAESLFRASTEEAAAYLDATATCISEHSDAIAESLTRMDEDTWGRCRPDLGSLSQLARHMVENTWASHVFPVLVLVEDATIPREDVVASVLEAVVRAAEEKVLELITYATGGLDWRWNANAEGRVVGIGALEAGASGPIPPALGQLASLRRLVLARNDFSGPIPPELGRLTKLEHLQLHDNELSGSIPLQLGQLTNLESLFLGNNELRGPIPVELGNLTALASLIIDNDTGLCLPAEMPETAFSRLAVEDDVPFCDGSTPEWATPVATGDFPPEDLSGLPESIWDSRASAEWTLRMQALIDEDEPLRRLMDEFTASRLQNEIELSGSAGRYVKPNLEQDFLNAFHAVSLELFAAGRFPTYTEDQFREADRELNRIYSELRGRDDYPFGNRPEELQFENMRNTQRLWLRYRDAWVEFGRRRYPQVSSWSWLGWITTWRNRQLEEIGGTPGYGPFVDGPEDSDVRRRVEETLVPASQGDAGISAGSPDRTALTALYAATNGEAWHNSENWLTDAPLGDWYGVQTRGGEVLIVSLGSNDLTGTIPPEIELLSTVHLYLGNNRLHGPIPKELAGVFRYDDEYYDYTLYGPELDLGGNEFTGAIPHELGAATLTSLDLSDNLLTGAIPPELGNLRAGHLDLSGNRLTGPIPPELVVGAGPEGEGGWLDLSNNQLTGSIPPNPGGNDVGYLDLSNNLLTGAIPPELGTWAMTTLDLSGNRLTGQIPPTLGDLAPVDPHIGEPVPVHLIDLSENRLTGPLPETFLQIAAGVLNLSGNDGLCIPATARFIEWMGRIGMVEAAMCDGGQGFAAGASASSGRSTIFADTRGSRIDGTVR